jgi:hypothetical protein
MVKGKLGYDKVEESPVFKHLKNHRPPELPAGIVVELASRTSAERA